VALVVVGALRPISLSSVVFNSFNSASCNTQEKVLPEEVELSNRVVREWAGTGRLVGEDFLRVTFGDENGGQLYMGHGADGKGDWGQHMKKVLNEGMQFDSSRDVQFVVIYCTASCS
jgi:hypothetical protein